MHYKHSKVETTFISNGLGKDGSIKKHGDAAPLISSIEKNEDVPSEFTKTNMLLLGSMAIMQFISNTMLTMLAPFYPGVADRRGLTGTQYSWVFGVFPLAMLAFAPVGKYMIATAGIQLTFLACLWSIGGSSILFGCLEYFPEGAAAFLGFSLALRIFNGFGVACGMVAGLTVTTIKFPENRLKALGVLTTANGAGLLLGPTVGSVLFKYGGFGVPFFVTGSIVILSIPIYWLVFKVALSDSDGYQEEGHEIPLTRILVVPEVMIVLFSLVVITLCVMSREPTLEIYLRDEYQMDTVTIGFAFTTIGIAYTVFSLLVGYVADKLDNTTILLITGQFFVGVAFLLLSRTSVFGLQNYKEDWLVFFALSLTGAGQAITMTPTYGRLIEILKSKGYEADLSLMALVSSTFTIGSGLGNFAGPIVGGMMTESLGFEGATEILSIFAFVLMFTLVAVLLYDIYGSRFSGGLCCKKDVEYTSLVDSSSPRKSYL